MCAETKEEMAQALASLEDLKRNWEQSYSNELNISMRQVENLKQQIARMKIKSMLIQVNLEVAKDNLTEGRE